MASKPSVLVIDLLSSPPPRHPPPSKPSITDRNNEARPSSSPLPPSPSAMFIASAERAAALKARKVQEAVGKVEIKSVWDVSDAEEAELPPLVAIKQPATKTAIDAKVKKTRTRKVTEKSKIEKKAPLKDGKIKATVTKNAMGQTKSRYFLEATEQSWLQRMAENHEPQPDLLVDGCAPKTALALETSHELPSYFGPPLHVVRREWTPVRNTGWTVDSSSPLVDGEPKLTKNAVFGRMVDVMRYSRESSESIRGIPVSTDRVGNGLTKKREIEMIGIPNPTTLASKHKPPRASKTKPPKKKPTTITDQATTSYRSVTDPKASPIMQYFSSQGGTPSQIEDTNTFSRKPGSPAKKKRKSDSETVILLSPVTARKRFENQDFVFGTSSQLEKADEDEMTKTYDTHPDEQNGDYDELPPVSTSVVRRDFLGTLAKDRKGGSLFRGSNGEREKDNPSAGSNSDVYVMASGIRGRPEREKGGRLGKLPETGSGLWNAAARDLYGGLLEVEVVDMTGSDNGDGERLELGTIRKIEDHSLLEDTTTTTGTPVIGRSLAHNDAEKSCQNSGRELHIVDGAVDISEINLIHTMRGPRDSSREASPSITGIIAPPAHLGRMVNPVVHRISLATSTGISGSSTRSMSSSTSCAAAPSATSIDRLANSTEIAPVAPKAKKSKLKSAPVMPDFQSYLTSKLKAEITKFGFKDMKTRDRMITCLERCWEAQNNVVARNTTQPGASDSEPVENTTEPQNGTNEEEITPILDLQGDRAAVAVLQKPKASAKQKTAANARAKSPGRKAAPKTKTLFKASNNVTSEVVAPSTEARSPRKSSARAPKTRAREPSVNPPSPHTESNIKNLHYHISEAVRESGDTESEFLFYRAILMYDPIVLEDLTQWLNKRPHLQVDVEDVKGWCEANGVCCVRNETLRGKQRKRF